MKNLTTACMIVAMSVGFTSASFAESEPPTDEPPVGCLSSECEEPDEKGNNGWGNGIDGVNPGTDEGTKWQVDTKSNVPGLDLGKFSKFEGR